MGTCARFKRIAFVHMYSFLYQIILCSDKIINPEPDFAGHCNSHTEVINGLCIGILYQ